MKNEKIIAVITTYNRKELLVECLLSCLNQTRKLDKIIIINNASSDGTIDLLKEKGLLNNKIINLVNLEKNEGGSAGANKGMKIALNNKADWIWIMDDDTIPQPNTLEQLTAVENLITPISPKKIGFLCSQVNWIDNEPHEMNTPAIKQLVNDLSFSLFSKNNCFLVKSCSFVSVLINKEAAQACGLPIKEFFIWGDDVEYTNRITDNNFLGIYVPSSIAIHKTKKKKESIITCSPELSQRFFYNARNNTYIFKKRRGFIFFWLIKFMSDIKSILKRKDNKLKFLNKIIKGYLAGLFFNPKIEF